MEDLEAVALHCGLSKQTMRNHLSRLLEYGWIRVNKENGKQYQIVSLYKFGNLFDGNHLQVMQMCDEEVMSITWKNRKVFTAKTIECAIHRYVKQKTAREYRESKSTRRGKMHDNLKGESARFISCSVGSSLTQLSKSTICRHRKEVTGMAVYEHQLVYLGHQFFNEYPDSEIEVLNAIANESNDLADKGKYFKTGGGSVYYSPIAFRKSLFETKRVRVRNKDWREGKQNFIDYTKLDMDDMLRLKECMPDWYNEQVMIKNRKLLATKENVMPY
jgi:hypothetical protein